MNIPPCPAELDSTEALADLQRMMAHAVMRPLTAQDGMQKKAPDGSRMNTWVKGFMKPNDRMSGFERLEIYNRQYWFRLLDCLYDDYPGLRVLLGQRRFHRLCIAYLEKFPSRSFTLRNLGSRLEDFLTLEPELAGGRFQEALDIVRFEWAQTVAFDEAMSPPLHVDELLGADPMMLKLGLQPYLMLLELNHAVDTFFMAVRQHESGMRTEASNAVEHGPSGRRSQKRVRPPARERIWLAVHRCENELYFLRLEQEAYQLLQSLRQGHALGQAVEEVLGNARPDVNWSGKLQDWFEQWSSLGWFCAPQTPATL